MGRRTEACPETHRVERQAGVVLLGVAPLIPPGEVWPISPVGLDCFPLTLPLKVPHLGTAIP